MASAAHAENSGFTFTFAMGLRGFHVYRNTENWKPVISQDVRFRREENNEKDRFAVRGFVRIPQVMTKQVQMILMSIFHLTHRFRFLMIVTRIHQLVQKPRKTLM